MSGAQRPTRCAPAVGEPGAPIPALEVLRAGNVTDACGPDGSPATADAGCATAVNPATYTVAVRELCEFASRGGDIDTRLAASPSAREGVLGHQEVTGRRPSGYQSEIFLSGRFDELAVRGRADGYQPSCNQLEEIKTYRGSLERVRAHRGALHWSQLKIYGWLYCEREKKQWLRLALVYFDVVSRVETSIVEVHSAEALWRHFEAQCSVFLVWARREIAHRALRSAHLAELAFPHGAFRSGQRELAEATFRACSQSRCLLIEAPTGIGKTVATLFPSLKAAALGALDKVFFLTAKTAGRPVVLEALAQIDRKSQPTSLRILELVARDSACEHPELSCHADSCPLAKGFYDRLSSAREKAVDLPDWRRATLRAFALSHALCPYYFVQELVRWADVVIADYNHYFDAQALLHGLSVAGQWRIAVLVDEAHNLVERGRSMYSAGLDRDQLGRALATAPDPLRPLLVQLGTEWQVHFGRHEFVSSSDPRTEAQLSQGFIDALSRTSAAVTELLSEGEVVLDPELEQWHFAVLRFTRLAENFDPAHSTIEVSGTTDHSRIAIQNLNPAPFLRARFAAARAAVLFSATLAPADFYRDTLGLPDDTIALAVQSPFRAEQLAVTIVDGISTRLRDRSHSIAPIVALIGEQFARQPGNYLAFFSSYGYLNQVAAAFQQRWPEIPSSAQSGPLDTQSLEAFLARFTVSSKGIGFAVLGGSLGEGIDLPGQRLIGVFIATLGLPQMNVRNEEIRRRMEVLFGAGDRYAYLYPGLRKVVQAAGRVIRSEKDRGILYLIDDRYRRPEIRELLPSWWDIGDRAGRPASHGQPLDPMLLPATP